MMGQTEIGTPAKIHAARMALAMYTNEPCRICGRMIGVDDLKDLVFAGYSKRWPARAAHGRCWRGFLDMCLSFGEKDDNPAVDERSE
jgi:hypothetical protein